VATIVAGCHCLLCAGGCVFSSDAQQGKIDIYCSAVADNGGAILFELGIQEQHQEG